MKDVILSQFTLEQLKNEITTDVVKKISLLLESHNPPKQQDDLITRKEAAKLLGVSLVTISDWTKTGKITGYRIASRIRYKRNEIETSLSQIKTRRCI